MSEPPQTPVTSAGRLRRRWLVTAGLLLLALLLTTGAREIYLMGEADRQLRAAVAEADRLDPHWRTDELEAGRAAVPDERNAALVVLEAEPLLPAGWKARLLRIDNQKRRLDEAGAATALRAELTKLAPAVAQARRLADLPEGRYPSDARPDDVLAEPPRPFLVDVANLLGYDAGRRAQDGDADGALASCRAALNAGRSVGDEPRFLSQMVRQVCRRAAVSVAERVLAQTEPSDAALRQLQSLLEAEEAEPLLLLAFRGERGSQYRALEASQTGKASLSPQLGILTQGATGANVPVLGSRNLRSPHTVKAQRAALLHGMNGFVEAAKLPPEQQGPRFAQLKADVKGDPEVVWFLDYLTHFALSCRDSQVGLRCAVVALAAERYRRDRGRWPERLQELTEADYLRRVPTDLDSGRPLRWRRLDDGAVVYSVGPDGRDGGDPQGTDPRFRLWDVAQRRQPPPKKEAPTADQVPKRVPPGADGK
jgi:hypothetical protein